MHVIGTYWWLWFALAVVFIGQDLRNWDRRVENINRKGLLKKNELDEIRRMVRAPSGESDVYTRRIAISMTMLFAIAIALKFTAMLSAR